MSETMVCSDAYVTTGDPLLSATPNFVPQASSPLRDRVALVDRPYPVDINGDAWAATDAIGPVRQAA